MMKRIFVQGLVGVATLAVVAVSATTAGAASRNMVGSLLVENPSAGFELPPGVYGRKVGSAGANTLPPTDGVQVVDAEGTAASTFVGRQINLPGSILSRTGFKFQDFPAFGNVGQVSQSYMTLQGAASFAENSGALAACPGPGCTSSGAGTAISWCPPVAHNPASPAPGNTAAPIGNWDCASWGAGAGGGDRFLRVSITNASGRNNFGGTLSLLRNHQMNVWRVPGAPSTPNASDAQAERSWMDIVNLPWSGGRSNFAYTELGGNNGPRVFARLNANGAVTETFGCTNGVGTVGGSFMANTANIGPGSNCGTDTNPNAPGQGWGFKMTTGTISGSDPYPFGMVVTTVGGSPFNPNFGTQPASAGFFFSRAGDDSITTGPNPAGSGSNRNLVMLGGGVAVDPDSGNAFFRITRLNMNLSVPEPATGMALVAGLGGLAFIARRRSLR